MFDLFDTLSPLQSLTVKVTPKAKSERIQRTVSSDGAVLYKVYVTAPPEDGKANEAVIVLLAKALGVAKSRLSIIHGHHGRLKTIQLSF